MKGWEKRTLPEDLHYSGHELVRLKVPLTLLLKLPNTSTNLLALTETAMYRYSRIKVEDLN